MHPFSSPVAAGLLPNAATMQRALRTALFTIAGSVEIINLPTTDSPNPVNVRAFDPERARFLLRRFRASDLTGMHVALDAQDSEASDWLQRVIDLDTATPLNASEDRKNSTYLASLFSVIRDRSGQLLPSPPMAAAIKLAAHCGVPELTKAALVSKGLLLAGGLPDGLKVWPITGNHSSYAGRCFVRKVSDLLGAFKGRIFGAVVAVRPATCCCRHCLTCPCPCPCPCQQHQRHAMSILLYY